MPVFNMSNQKVESQFNVSSVDHEIKKHISVYKRKISDQENLEEDLLNRIRKMRGLHEDYNMLYAELKVVRAKEQCYVQALVDFESLLEV